MKVNSNQKIESLKKILVLNRIEILKLLLEKETCVCQMVNTLNLKHNLISHHLKVLSDMGFIISRRKGQHITYRVVEDKRNLILEIMKLINYK